MDQEPVLYKPKTVRIFMLIYVAALLYSIHFFFIYFVNSSFLEGYFKSTAVVGLLYSIGAIVNLFIFLNIGKILNRTGNYQLMLGLILLEIFCLGGLAYFQNIYLIGLL